ncbi:hypothetical protein ACI3ET_00150 [Ornithinimicrobium sp. LYQ121]|uniref:hypothetical protein n=1 Tax=Ornithinimicrobium sp. LYQ121 TaxID=3378801 RepID=UPI003852383C
MSQPTAPVIQLVDHAGGGGQDLRQHGVHSRRCMPLVNLLASTIVPLGPFTMTSPRSTSTQ